MRRLPVRPGEETFQEIMQTGLGASGNWTSITFMR